MLIMIILPFTGVGDTLKEKELKAHAERANIFLENYAKMQRDIEEGNFVLKKTTQWQMPDGYSSQAATSSGNSGSNSETGERAPLDVTPVGTQHAHTTSELREYENGLQESVARHVRPPPRPIYTGGKSGAKVRQERDHLVSYILGESEDGDYDVQFEKMTKRSMAILLAPESEKLVSERDRQYGFRVHLGRAAGWSDYLYLCEVQDQITNDEGVNTPHSSWMHQLAPLCQGARYTRNYPH